MSLSSALLFGIGWGVCSGLAFYAVLYLLPGGTVSVSQLPFPGSLWVIGGLVWGLWMRSKACVGRKRGGTGHP